MSQAEGMTDHQKKENFKNKLVPWYFVMFFAVIFILDGIFVYLAVSSQPGVVVEQAYEKGLAYNDAIEAAKNQPKWQDRATLEGGVLRLYLNDAQGNPIQDATVTAAMIRPVQQGYDFDLSLESAGAGIYEASLTLPLKGEWRAKLTAQQGDKIFRATHEFITE